MAIIQCPECGKDVSSAAESCPQCGYPLKKGFTPQEPIKYETTTVKIRCWGRGKTELTNKLSKYTDEGWEVVSMVEDEWLGGILSPVYKVVIKRPIKSKA